MDKRPKKVKKRKPRSDELTEKELKALELKTKHPQKSNHQIGKEMVKLGLTSDPAYLNHRIQKSSVIRDKTAILREKYQLKITNQVPKALQVTRHHLKANNLKAAALVMKHALPTQDDMPAKSPTIHIDTLVQLQQVNLNAMQDRLDAIDVSESSSDNK